MPKSSSISESDDSIEEGTRVDVPCLGGAGGMEDWPCKAAEINERKG